MRGKRKDEMELSRPFCECCLKCVIMIAPPKAHCR